MIATRHPPRRTRTRKAKSPATSLFGLLTEMLTSSVSTVVEDLVRDSCAKPLDWALGRILVHLCAGTLLATGTVFALLAVVEGLQAASVPAYGSYAAASLLAIVAGWIGIKTVRTRAPRD